MSTVFLNGKLSGNSMEHHTSCGNSVEQHVLCGNSVEQYASRGNSVEQHASYESDVGHREQQCRRHGFSSVSVDYRCDC